MTALSLESIRDRIAGPESLLVIEAPAGHGKTHEAVEATKTAAGSLNAGQRVLFLTHTHAARATFNSRLTNEPATMKTIHSLAAEIVDLYAEPLGLPRPLQPTKDKPSHNDTITLATQVLENRPEVAIGLATRHPVILVDEYQDCTLEQGAFIDAIARARPTRLRLFGDDLQAIYEFSGDLVDFTELTSTYPTVRLEIPRRWPDQPELEQFILSARAALAAGEQVDLRYRPSCVMVSVWNGPVPPIHPKGYAPECVSALRELGSGQVMCLTLHNDHALGLRIKMPYRGGYHEGANHEAASAMLDLVVEAEGDAQRLSALLVRAMTEWGQGMTKTYREQIAASTTPTGIDIGRRQKIARFAALLETLYAAPTTATWLSCLRLVVNDEHGIDGWKMLRRDQLYVLARVRPAPGDDPQSLLLAAAHARSSTLRSPSQGFTTIHKAKGLQFDGVALPYLAGSLFGDDLESRRRLYVAISRAQRHLHFLIPSADPTPLLRI